MATKTCPNCGQDLFAQATVCTNCGADVSNVLPDLTTRPLAPSELDVSQQPTAEIPAVHRNIWEIITDKFPVLRRLRWPWQQPTQRIQAVQSRPHRELEHEPRETERQASIRERGYFPFLDTFRRRAADTMTTRIIRVFRMQNSTENRIFIGKVLYQTILVLIVLILVFFIILGLVIRHGGF